MSQEREIGDLLNRVVSGLRRDMERHAAELAVSRLEWAVLLPMYYDSLRDRFSTPEGIWARVEMPLEQVRELLRALEERGFVRRERDGWSLTDDGLHRTKPLTMISESIMTKTTAGLTAAEMADLAAVLRQMCANLGIPSEPGGDGSAVTHGPRVG